MAVDQRVRAGTSVAPLGAVDVDAFESNARAMVARAGGLPIRVASKSLCSVEALRYTLSFDGFQGILAFSIPEVIALVGEGFTDIVVAYPSVNRPALAQLAADEKLRATITVMVDETAHLDLLDSLGAGPVRVAIDLDCTLRLPTEKLGALVLGPRRSPLRTPEQVAAFARDIVGRPNLKLVGMMAYEGQVASVAGGETGPVGAVKRWIRTRSLNDLAPRRAACIAAAREVADLEFVNGGTGSLHESAAEGTLTELAAGSGLYTPAIFDRFTALEHRAAAFFVCQVSRIPAPGWATVNSGGWIASGPPAADRVPVPVLPVGLKYSAAEGAGEVQTPLHGRAVKNVNVGDLVWFRHAKAGEMTENVDSLLAVRHDGTVEEWSTYRGKGWICR
ncbi:alanine racemase [Corynebacterium phoceense]|uniref:alanine racemase n=1 Tax=Corynebacterium phoceense TaxID=1686286 RepID=UPI001D932278|nr:alanine racemase [Corynebacterium phoceense]HJG43384.1 alanine racemase [Corynebacterium phoceense]